jgi:hypothetical protein
MSIDHAVAPSSRGEKPSATSSSASWPHRSRLVAPRGGDRGRTPSLRQRQRRARCRRAAPCAKRPARGRRCRCPDDHDGVPVGPARRSRDRAGRAGRRCRRGGASALSRPWILRSFLPAESGRPRAKASNTTERGSARPGVTRPSLSRIKLGKARREDAAPRRACQTGCAGGGHDRAGRDPARAPGSGQQKVEPCACVARARRIHAASARTARGAQPRSATTSGIRRDQHLDAASASFTRAAAPRAGSADRLRLLAPAGRRGR